MVCSEVDTVGAKELETNEESYEPPGSLSPDENPEHCDRSRLYPPFGLHRLPLRRGENKKGFALCGFGNATGSCGRHFVLVVNRKR